MILVKYSALVFALCFLFAIAFAVRPVTVVHESGPTATMQPSPSTTFAESKANSSINKVISEKREQSSAALENAESSSHEVNLSTVQPATSFTEPVHSNRSNSRATAQNAVDRSSAKPNRDPTDPTHWFDYLDQQDFNERTPERDLEQYRLYRSYAYRQNALHFVAPFFRMFYAPAIQELEIVEEVIEFGTLSTEALMNDQRLAELTNEGTPYMGYLCSKTRCLIAWYNAIASYTSPADQLCEYINNQHGNNCQALVLNDWQITPRELHIATDFCRFGASDSPPSTEERACFNVLLSPVQAVIFDHQQTSQPSLQGFYSRKINDLDFVGEQAPERVTEHLDEHLFDYIDERSFNTKTVTCGAQSCLVDLPNYSLDFQPFHYSQLAARISVSPYTSLDSLAQCYLADVYQNNDRPTPVDAQLECYPQLYFGNCHSKEACDRIDNIESVRPHVNMTWLWQWMQTGEVPEQL